MNSSSSEIYNKDIRLTRQLSFIALAGSIFYFLFDLVSGAYAYMNVYLVLILGAYFSLYLLKKNKTNWAKASLLLSANAVVACFASVETLETGIYFYFVILSVAALTLYGYSRIRTAFIFIGLSTSLFLLFLFTGFQLIPEVELTPEYIKTSLVINFIIILIVTVLIVYYLLLNNHISEITLNRQRESLAKTARELESSQRRFKLAIEGTSAAIWDWNIRKDYFFVTRKLAEIIKSPLGKIQGSKKDDFLKKIHPDDRPHVLNQFYQHFKDEKPYEVECRLHTTDDDYVWVLHSGKAEFDITGQPVRMVGTIIDIHDKKVAVEQVKEQNKMLAKANKELDRFVYSTSHDLRAPLSSLLGLLNIAGHTVVKEERDELIGMMRQQIIKLDSYIQDITDYSRNARVDVEKEAFLLYEVIEEAVQNHKFMDGADTIEVICSVNKDLKIVSDKQRFKVIINNIISNAIKYQSEEEKKSYLKIYSGKAGKQYLIFFDDNGEGIEPVHQAKIFDMFFRASVRSRGSGLGLYIAKETAAKLNMQLQLTSTHLEGSVFKVIIPQEDVILA